MSFSIIAQDPSSRARVGRLDTLHGSVETPAFMPVGTQGTVKALSPRDLEEVSSQIILANTYHLYLRPGADLIRDLGGLHDFMGWTKPILTDSGGYQVFSLGRLRKITEDGVRFHSHLDGAAHFLTPESAIEIQQKLGSDIAMVLDECIPYPSPREYVKESTDRTVRWAKRSLDVWGGDGNALFAILQGGVFKDLREECAQTLTDCPFDGYAVGGLGVGEGERLLADIGDFAAGLLPEERPRYLMGLGKPADLILGVQSGYDLFDCVLPTRNARNGSLFTASGTLNIKRAEFARDKRPVDECCQCYGCRNFSRAYLRHLYLAGEILSAYLNTLHNVYFYHWLMAELRNAIKQRRDQSYFEDLRQNVEGREASAEQIGER